MFSLEHAVAHLPTINPTGINGCQISSMMNIVSEHANDSDKFLSMIFVIFWFVKRNFVIICDPIFAMIYLVPLKC